MKLSTPVYGVLIGSCLASTVLMTKYAKASKVNRATKFVTLTDVDGTCEAPKLLSTLFRRNYEGVEDLWLNQSLDIARVGSLISYDEALFENADDDLHLACQDEAGVWSRGTDCFTQAGYNPFVLTRNGVGKFEEKINDSLSETTLVYLNDLFSRSTCSDPTIFVDVRYLLNPNQIWLDD